MTSRFLVYALIDPRSNVIRYIGKSTIGITRAHKHKNPCSLRNDDKVNPPKAAWIRELINAGTIYGVEVLCESSDAISVALAEREEITRGRAAGLALLNRTGGGERLPGAEPANKGKPATEEHKAKLRAAWLTRSHTQSEETKRKRSESLKLAYKEKPRAAPSEETRKKIADSLRGRTNGPRSSETCERISIAKRAGWAARKAAV